MEIEKKHQCENSAAAFIELSRWWVEKVRGPGRILGTEAGPTPSHAPRASDDPTPAKPPSTERVVDDVVQRLNQIPPKSRLEALSAVQRQLIQHLVDEQRLAKGAG